MKISVLLATYNGEEYISEQLDSLMNQSLKDFYVYISDDGSKDTTMEIIKKYMQQYSNIILLPIHNPTGSACKNFFYLLKKVDSDLYFFCDQDDVWTNDHISNIVDVAKQMDNSLPFLIHSDLFVVNEKLEIKNASFFEFSNIKKYPLSYKYYLVQNNVTGCSMCINNALKELAIGTGFQDIEHLIPMHDWWFALIASRFGDIKFLETKSLFYRQHSDNSVGAKNVKSYSYKISRFFNKKANEKSIQMSKDITTAFIEVFKDLLEPKEVNMLENYLHLEKSKISKIIFLKRNSLFKDTLSRKIMQILYI